MIRPVKMREELAVRVCPPRTDEDGLHVLVLLEVYLECLLHGERIASEVEVVRRHADVYELIDFSEWVLGHDIDCV